MNRPSVHVTATPGTQVTIIINGETQDEPRTRAPSPAHRAAHGVVHVVGMVILNLGIVAWIFIKTLAAAFGGWSNVRRH